MIRISILMTIVMALSVSAFAGSIDSGRAINAIIGEAEGEPYRGKLAVACAIRNRGTLDGVYGEKASRVVKHRYSQSVLEDARRAWQESADQSSCTFIDGADHWEGTAFKTPKWSKNMIVTATIGHQRFYRRKK